MKNLLHDPITRARIEGMELAMRVCRNRAHGFRTESGEGDRENEAETCAGIIRLVQVNIGSGRTTFPEFTPDERDEIERIS